MDMAIWLGRKKAPALGLRLVAVRKPAHAIAESRRKARRAAQRERSQISGNTLIAAEWVILVTSLPPEDYSADDVLALYRLRWRIELAFKRLKSLIGLKAPPGVDERSAKPYVLAHLLVILLLEPLIDEFEDFSPLGTSRLTRPGAWRLLLQLTATFLQAIMPQPSLADLRRAKDKLRRHLHEPPRRRRKYQRMARLF